MDYERLYRYNGFARKHEDHYSYDMGNSVRSGNSDYESFLLDTVE